MRKKSKPPETGLTSEENMPSRNGVQMAQSFEGPIRQAAEQLRSHPDTKFALIPDGNGMTLVPEEHINDPENAHRSRMFTLTVAGKNYYQCEN